MHIPVLQKEVIQYLEPKRNENFIDCTIGEGGHSLAILEETGPKGKILGIDQDPEVIENLKSKLKDLGLEKRVILICDNFSNLAEIVRKERFKSIAGILFDLGMSSWHLEESKRGFSFLRLEPLDMRYNPDSPLTAAKILNFWSKVELERILKEFGEEQFAPSISKAIVEERKRKPIENTFQLVRIISRAIPRGYQRRKIHFATQTFQALRIAVNQELERLRKGLEQAKEVLGREGRLLAISFHSLEDRIVKNFFKGLGSDYQVLTKKPVRPGQYEIRINPRSRSARLRAIKKYARNN